LVERENPPMTHRLTTIEQVRAIIRAKSPAVRGKLFQARDATGSPP
jgi:hypothetical protein